MKELGITKVDVDVPNLIKLIRKGRIPELSHEGLEAVVSELLQQRDELREALKELMEGVRGLPPLTAIAGTLTKQYEKAQRAITKTEEK